MGYTSKNQHHWIQSRHAYCYGTKNYYQPKTFVGSNKLMHVFKSWIYPIINNDLRSNLIFNAKKGESTTDKILLLYMR